MTGRRTTVLTLQEIAGRDLATNATFREWAAALALQGLLASSRTPYADDGVADLAVMIADALIAALAVEREQA